MQAAQMEKVLPWAIIALFLWFFWVYASGWFNTFRQGFPNLYRRGEHVTRT